jgi:hypothetical protein
MGQFQRRRRPREMAAVGLQLSKLSLGRIQLALPPVLDALELIVGVAKPQCNPRGCKVPGRPLGEDSGPSHGDPSLPRRRQTQLSLRKRFGLPRPGPDQSDPRCC